MEILLKSLTVLFLSAVKFIFGPTLGISYGFGIVITAILTILGMMTTVYSLSYFEKQIHGFIVYLFERKKKRKLFTKKNRRFVKLWRRYGLKGVAFLTPVLFTPIGGTLLANAVGGTRKEIFKWMWISSTFWAFTITLVVKFAHGLLKELPL